MATILIVDDDPAARDLIVTVLGYAGHTIREAADGADALAQLRDVHPDLIIADLLMPTMDGFEFVRHVRVDARFATTPIMFYTATYLESEVKSMIEACGVAGVITKPAEPEAILSKVASVLGSAPRQVAPVPLLQFHREHIGVLTAKLSRMAAEATPRLEVMIELSLKLASERDPRQLLEHFCSSARKIIGAKYAAVGVLDAHDKRVRYQFVSGMNAEASNRVTAPEMVMPVQPEWLTDPQTLRFTSINGNPETVGLPAAHPPVHSFLRTPIVSPDRVYGWLCLADRIGAPEFNEEDEGLARILAAQVGRIYENGSLYAELRNRAQALEREIEERERIEAALRRSEQHLRQLVDGALDTIFTISPDGRFSSLNPAFETATGYRRAEWIGRPYSDLIHVDDLTLAREMFARVVEAQEPQAFEIRIKAASGSVRVIDLRMSRITSDDPHSDVLGIGRDMTERRNLEAQMRQVQKMETIGQLAGGVAHDFNNILTVVQGHAAFIRAAPGLAAETRESVQEILMASERAAQLTRQLLAFSRRQVMQPQNLDLNLITAGLMKMLQRIVGEDIELRFEPKDERAPIFADAGMVEQVLLNLVVNARDAMPLGGVLTISTAHVLAHNVARPPDVEKEAEAYVHLSVRDTGSGIEPSILSRIFEPFFTTKPVGKGTGLGLATVHGIVHQHRGWVAVESQVGAGTVFHVYLPLTELPGKGVAGRETSAGIRGGNETILLVEDELPVRKIARSVLERNGYRVIEAETGVQAREILAKQPEAIDLVFTDVIMPGGMTGRQLAEEFWALRPGLKIVFASGYHAAITGAGFMVKEGTNFLQKPYDMNSLLRTIRAALDAKT